MENKRPGVMIDNFLVTFPPDGDLIREDEDGSFHILCDIYTVDDNDNRTPVEQSEITPELEEKISNFINGLLEEAIKDYKEKQNG